MNQQETAMALRHNGRVEDTFAFYRHFVMEGRSPEEALLKARQAVMVFEEWASNERIEIPIEVQRQFFSPALAIPELKMTVTTKDDKTFEGHLAGEPPAVDAEFEDNLP